MEINTSLPYGGSCQDYRINELPQVNTEPDKALKPLESGSDSALNMVSGNTEVQLPDNRSRSADLKNISLTFHKNDEFDYLGRDSEIEKLDMEKAISDMQKDSILQEYQYFVGSTRNLAASPENESGKIIFR